MLNLVVYISESPHSNIKCFHQTEKILSIKDFNRLKNMSEISIILDVSYKNNFVLNETVSTQESSQNKEIWVKSLNIPG